ncbi:hypothetical protein HK099_004024 [Clydaea vesicula]|uniref:Uncharacterized protein n=1 Tax=Clydaea vesicula TaxID=447962 RepID=A0AAD5U0R8_9FUNG|nr:hypothetical protein HK099_004024 [Clydaea vesicula]
MKSLNKVDELDLKTLKFFTDILLKHCTQIKFDQKETVILTEKILLSKKKEIVEKKTNLLGDEDFDAGIVSLDPVDYLLPDVALNVKKIKNQDTLDNIHPTEIDFHHNAILNQESDLLLSPNVQTIVSNLKVKNEDSSSSQQKKLHTPAPWTSSNNFDFIENQPILKNNINFKNQPTKLPIYTPQSKHARQSLDLDVEEEKRDSITVKNLKVKEKSILLDNFKTSCQTENITKKTKNTSSTDTSSPTLCSAKKKNTQEKKTISENLSTKVNPEKRNPVCFSNEKSQDPFPRNFSRNSCISTSTTKQSFCNRLTYLIPTANTNNFEYGSLGPDLENLEYKKKLEMLTKRREYSKLINCKPIPKTMSSVNFYQTDITNKSNIVYEENSENTSIKKKKKKYLDLSTVEMQGSKSRNNP